MRIYIASSKKYVGKIEEDLYLRDAYLKKKINSDILSLEDIIERVLPEDVVILRSIWGYHINYQEFLQQISILKERKIELINDYDFIFWNINKYEYLRDVKEMNVVPTRLFRIGSFHTISEVVESLTRMVKIFQSDKIVVKPCISASGYLTSIFDINEDNDPIGQLLFANKHLDFIIQPYYPSILEGEMSIILLAGKHLYGIQRYPGVLGDKKDPVYKDITNIPNLIINESNKVMEFLFKKFHKMPDICRIDFIRNKLQYKVLEIELIDPDLFLKHVPENLRLEAISILSDRIKTL